MNQTVITIFIKCVEAITQGILIQRVSSTDKEFHFQNWFKDRLEETGFNFEIGGRNSYPDFRMVKSAEGYELKGLAYPGRSTSFDNNSQAPRGFHNGRNIYYVFGRYPKNPDGDEYPVLDLVICHGNFLNIDYEYIHKNKSVKGFGSYGDIMIRDRKMYVAPTPFHLAKGLAHQCTLILPFGAQKNKNIISVGELSRKETSELIVGYSFNLKTNELIPQKIPNPNKGKKHIFQAWRVKGISSQNVSLNSFENKAL